MLLRHTFFYFVGRGVPALLNLVGLSLFTTLLEPAEYGRYVLVLATLLLGNALMFQWISLSLQRLYAAEVDRPAALLSTLAGSYVVLTTVITVIGGIWIIAYDPPYKSLAWMAVVLLWLHGWFEITKELARAQLSPARFGIMATAKSGIAIGVGATLAWLGWGSMGLLIGLAVGLALPLAVVTPSQWALVRPRHIRGDILKQTLSYGLPLTAAFALSYIINTSDRFMLGYMSGAESAGVYAVGYDLAFNSLMLPLMGVTLAGFPLVMRAMEKEGEAAASRQLEQNFTLLLALSLPAAAGLIMLTPNIVKVFLGEQYQQAAMAVMPWIAVAVLVDGLRAHFLDHSFHLRRYALGTVWVLLPAAITNVILNLLWIPTLSIMGATYATVAAYTVAMVASLVLSRRCFPMPWPGRQVGRVVLSTGIMIVALWPIRNYAGLPMLLVQVTCGGLVYIVAIWLTNAGNSRDVMTRLLLSRVKLKT